MRTMRMILAFLFPALALAQDPFVAEGACPGEGCRYDEHWIAIEEVRLLQSPDPSAEAVVTLEPGDAVRTLTGEVHTIPARFVVREPRGAIAPGDEVLVYTYLGEGWFRVRHNGTLKEADLGFSPWGGSAGPRCDDPSQCWGTLQEELQFEWWIKVRTENGMEGWVLGEGSFERPADH